MRKGVILVLFGTAIYFVLRSYYKNPTNQGIPNPRALVGPVYLYAILALVSDFLGGFPIVIAAALTLALIWDSEKQGTSYPSMNPQGNQVTPTAQPGSQPNAQGVYPPVNPNGGGVGSKGQLVNPYTGSPKITKMF